MAALPAAAAGTSASFGEQLRRGGGLRAAAVLAVGAAAAATTSSPGHSVSRTPLWLARLAQQFVLRWKRIGGGRVWPPTAKTAPIYLAFWAAISAIMYFGFVRTGRSEEAEAEKRRKRTYAEASLTNVLEWEAARLKEEARPNKSGPDDKSKCDEKKKPPDVDKMLSLLFDDVEGGSITTIGVSQGAVWYRQSVALLKARIEAELREAIDGTRAATGAKPPPCCSAVTGTTSQGPAMSTPAEVAAVEEEYKDGEKLQSLLNKIDDKVFPAFGKRLVDRAVVREAKELVKIVAARRAAAVARIWGIFRPLGWKWATGTAILMVTECNWGFLHGALVSMANLAHNVGAGTMPKALSWGMMIGAGFLFNWPLDNLGDTLVDAVEAKMQLGLRTAVMESLLRQDREYFDHHQSGVLQERLNKDTEDLARTIIQQPKNLISALTRILVKSAFLYYVSPGLFWLGVTVPVPLCTVAEVLGWRGVTAADEKISKVSDQAAGNTSELLREVSTVRQFGMEEEELRRYKNIAIWREQLETSLLTIKRYTRETMYTIFTFSELLLTYWGLRFCAAGTLPAAHLMLAVYQLDGIVWGASQIADLIPEVARLMQPLSRVATLLDAVPSIEPHPEHPGAGTWKPAKFEGRMVFDKVDFTYPAERQKQVLHGLSFEVKPQTKVAFVGKAGCGKSTSVTLIQRFYNVSKGSILIDNRPIEEYDVHNLRRHIGVVAQDNILFSTSIIENIVYGMGQGHLPKATMEMVVAACDAANVSEFVADFPNGHHTFIGEKGVKLSGGQKQRLAIARAIIRKPTILLLDEATSALDSVNEKEVQKALDEMLVAHRGVAIVIAHRLTTIKNCDKIIVMDSGTKVEEGTHEELLKIKVETIEEPNKDDAGDNSTTTKVLKGHYHRMWDTQMGEETFSDAKAMTDDQLVGKLSFHRAELQRLEAEAKSRPSVL